MAPAPPATLQGNWLTFADGVGTTVSVTAIDRIDEETTCSSGVASYSRFRHRLNVQNATAAWVNVLRFNSGRGVSCVYRDRAASAEIGYWTTFSNRETTRMFNGSISADGSYRNYYGFSVANPKIDCITMNGLIEGTMNGEGQTRFTGYICFPEGKMNRAEVERIVGAMRFRRPS